MALVELITLLFGGFGRLLGKAVASPGNKHNLKSQPHYAIHAYSSRQDLPTSIS
jgi:hypothetical protein